MNQVRFEDFSDNVSEAIKNVVLNWLEEASSELESQTITRSRSREVAERWSHVVNKDKFTAYVGNPMEHAIWEEFGTGEYALKGNGRKGYWVYVKDSNNNTRSTKQYTLDEAKQVMAYLRSKGLEAFYTCGQEPVRALHYAFFNNEEELKDYLRSQLRSL